MATTQLLDNSLELQKDLYSIIVPEESVIRTAEFRKEYAKVIAAAPFSDESRADEIVASKDNEPIFEIKKMHPEDQPKRTDLVQMATDIAVDLTTADYQVVNTANRYTALIAGTINRMNAIKERILRNKERLEDINFITAAYKGLSDSVIITEDLCSGSYLYHNGVYGAFCSQAPSEIKKDVQILSVEGNGYVGNAHVLTQGDKYLEDTDNRGNLEYISDDSPLTVFEYSRICSKDVSQYRLNKSTAYDVNQDDKDVNCIITLMSKNASGINMVDIDSAGGAVVIKDVLVSSDNINYRSILQSEIDMRVDMYHAANQIAGSGKVCFPTSRYVKLVLSSSYCEPGEVLGYSEVDLSGEKPEVVIRRLKNAMRKVIKIGSLNAYECEYDMGNILTGDLAPTEGCKTVAVFANECVPYGIENPEEAVKYTLYINGVEYPVVPINSDKPGIKMISCTESQFEGVNVKFIGEKIKTIQLRVKIESGKGMTPFVGNLKLCIG